MLADDVHALIRAAAVDDDVLEIRVILREHGIDSFLKKLPLIKGGGDDGDSWHSAANRVAGMQRASECAGGGDVVLENFAVPAEVIISLPSDVESVPRVARGVFTKAVAHRIVAQ